MVEVCTSRKNISSEEARRDGLTLLRKQSEFIDIKSFRYEVLA